MSRIHSNPNHLTNKQSGKVRTGAYGITMKGYPAPSKKSYKPLYNEVIDEIREFGFTQRTKYEVKPNGSVVGEGWTSSKDDQVVRKLRAETGGTCVRESLAVVVKLRKRTGVKWIQGEILSRFGGWKSADENRGMPIYHCWVEFEDKVYDFSNGSKCIADRDLYYMYRRVQKTQELPYSFNSDGDEVSFNSDDRRPFYEMVRRKQRKLGYNAE